MSETYQSSDYIGGNHGETSYYYGYEASKCKECGKFNSGEYCDDCDDADRDWCFQVKRKGNVIFTETCTELGAPDMFDLRDCFTRGMMAWAEAADRQVCELRKGLDLATAEVRKLKAAQEEAKKQC